MHHIIYKKGKILEENNLFTPYDEMIQTREVQMLKTLVPFLEGSRKRQLAMLIQCMEIRHTSALFSRGSSALSACEIPEGTDRRSAMLVALKDYCTPREQEMIDTILNLFSVMENYDLFFN